MLTGARVGDASTAAFLGPVLTRKLKEKDYGAIAKQVCQVGFWITAAQAGVGLALGIPGEALMGLHRGRARDALNIAVHNDGAAVAPELAERLFEPFFTTRATGTGLGLAVVRRIAEDVGERLPPEPDCRVAHRRPPAG